MRFNNAWIGYDLPYETIEQLPDVRAVRALGVEKRVKSLEHHVTLGHFESVEISDLRTFVTTAEAEDGRAYGTATLAFDGAGRMVGEKGMYVYFSPADGGAEPALALKRRMAASFASYDVGKNCRDLHLSIGGADPFCLDKPKLEKLGTSFAVEGKLVFVGNDGKGFRKYAWDGEAKKFVEVALPAMLGGSAPARQQAPRPAPSGAGPRAPKPVVQRDPLAINTIVIFPKIQPDTAAAIFLLRKYGERLFPGAATARVEFMTALPAGKTAEDFEKEGVLLIDHGKSRFDHHTDDHGRRKECASSLVADYLGVSDRPELRKLLSYAKRDDLEGKGTLSTDPLDRAFGLSGLIMNLNRVHGEDPQSVLDFVVALFEAHVFDEYHRAVVMPAEWKRLKAAGGAKEIVVDRGGVPLRLIGLESADVSLPGFLRAYAKADVVVQRLPSGHTNVITRQQTRVDLKEVIAAIRREEASKKGATLAHDDEAFRKPNALEGVEEWFYDTAANTLQNGGVRPIGVTPTRLDLATVFALVERHVRMPAAAPAPAPQPA